MNYFAIASRSLIALLFVVAGFQKLMNFGDTAKMLGEQMHLPLATLVTAGVVFIEIVVALAFAYGYKTKIAGYVLIAFTVLATAMFHNKLSDPLSLIMALKNVAIIGGIMSALACACDDCTVHAKKKHGEHNNA